MRHSILSILFLIIFFSGCYKYTGIDYDYAQYNRLVGIDGGHVIFYANYAADSAMFFADSSQILVELDVPAGALDTEIVFNFYQYENYNVAQELSKGLAKVGSKFFYFVPVFASDGYHEHDDADLTYHISLDFNKPVSVTYYYREDLSQNTIDDKKLKFEYYDWFNKYYKLYRIKIPKIDEWGEDRNIFVQWNQQGYPIGYNTSDIKDLIQGLWYPFSSEGVSVSNLQNWEEVDEYTIDESSQSVSFDIESTDYFYVLAKVIEISLDKIPYKVLVYLNNNFSYQISHAAIVNQMLQIILEDGTIAYFDRAGNFDRAEKYNISAFLLPTQIVDYLSDNNPNEQMQGNRVQYYESYTLYQMNLTNSHSFLFLDDNSTIEYLGSFVYDYDFSLVSQDIIDYINSNYPDAQINTVTNFNMMGDEEITVYIVYEGKNIKLYFDSNSKMVYSVYYGLKIQDIPTEVKNYLSSNYPEIDIAMITKTATLDSNYFDIELLNDTDIEIKENGDLISVYSNILIQDIPDAVLTTLADKFTSSNILYSYYVYYYGAELYVVQYAGGLYTETTPTGVVDFATSPNFSDLPENAKNYIMNNYSQNQFSDFEYLKIDNNYRYIVYLKDDSSLVFDDDGNFISYKLHLYRPKHTKILDRKPKKTTL